MPPAVPGYVNLVEIGHGGFAVVYRAHDQRFYRSVAIKVLTGPIDAESRKRFDRERRAMGALSRHPHCVTVYDSGFTSDDQPYLVMEDLSGGSLRQRIDQGPMPWREVVAIGVKLAGALDAAHEAGVLHRDVKPENVLCSAYGEPKIADFGIARLEADTLTSGKIFATPAHAAPELFEGSRPTKASDVYSLGSTLFMLMAGTAPFVRRQGEPAIAVITRASREAVPDLRPAGVPDAVCAVLEEAMAKRPDDRPTAAEVGRLLRDAQRELGIEPTPMAVRVAAIPAVATTTDESAMAEESGAADALRAPSEPDPAAAQPEPSPEPAAAVAQPEQSPELAVAVAEPEAPAEPPVAEPEPSPEPEPEPLSPSGAVPPTERERPVPVKAVPQPIRTPPPKPRRANRVRAVAAAVAAVTVAALVITVAVSRGDDSRDEGGRAASPTTAASPSRETPPPTAPGTIEVPAAASASQMAAQAIEVGEAPTGLAFGDGSVWVGNFSDGVATANVGGEPIGVAADGSDAWVASYRNGTVSRVAPGGQVVSRTEVGGSPVGVAVGEGAVWVTNRAGGTLTRIDPATGEAVARVGIGGSPLGVAVGEGSVWVTNEGDNTVSRVDPSTNAVVATIPVGLRPFRVAAGAGAIWVTNRAEGTVSRIDPGTRAVSGTFGGVGAGPSRVMVAQGSVWVTDENGRAVFRLDPAA
jgi:serine/threonine-protein kinase PknK